jgi:hypothetical protein
MSTEADFLTDLPLAGNLIATNFDGWSSELKAEFEKYAFDGEVGSRLLSENERVRVWEIRLSPGACAQTRSRLFLDRGKRWHQSPAHLRRHNARRELPGG